MMMIKIETLVDFSHSLISQKFQCFLAKTHFTLKEHRSPSFFSQKTFFQNNENMPQNSLGRNLWSFGIPSFIGIDTS
jgi:hypothetical protein